MDFRFTQDQDAAAELAASILKDRTTTERLKVVEAGGDRFDNDLWQVMGSSGLLGFGVPEKYGTGYGLIELARVLVEVGPARRTGPAGGPRSRAAADLRVRVRGAEGGVAARRGHGRSRADGRPGRGPCLRAGSADDRGRPARAAATASPAARLPCRRASRAT